MRSRLASLAVAGASVLYFSAAAQASTSYIFYENFENPGSISSQLSYGAGTTVTSTEGYGTYANGTTSNGLGVGDNYLRNNSVSTMADGTRTSSAITLSFTGLAAHDSISLGFLLATIDSWDGMGTQTVGGKTVGPDYFHVSVDGVEVFKYAFDNYRTGDSTYEWNSSSDSIALIARNNGGQNLAGNSDAASGNSDVYDFDYLYDLGKDPLLQDIAHTGSTLTIQIWADGAGWQGSDESWWSSTYADGYLHTTDWQDESFALDNIWVALNNSNPNPAPLPAAFWLLGAGLLGLVGRRAPGQRR